jgi:hypothetical protein
VPEGLAHPCRLEFQDRLAERPLAVLDWIDKPAETLRDYLAGTVYSERATKRFTDLPTQAAPTGRRSPAA